MKSPFKFLDSYIIADRNIFFGRDQEITDLYRSFFESNLLLVYGISGTGKSSLINCGLASRFDGSDWLPVNVRCGNNIIESLNEAFNKQALTLLKKNLSVYEKRGKLLTTDDLKYIAPYEDKLYLNKPSELFINKSKNEIARTKRRMRNFVSAAALALFIVLFGFTLWALKEKQKSNQNYLTKKASNFNYLSKEIAERDPTIALRLAEYAVSIDTFNRDIIMNLNRIYSDNNFYRIVSTHERGILSVAQKVKYSILGFKDILKLDDEKSVDEAACYYYSEINTVGKDRKTEYINNTINLYDKLLIKFKNTRYNTRKDSLMLNQKE